MIENGGAGGFVATCDVCGEEKFADVEAVAWAVDHIKKEGWSVKKIEGEWEHMCPTCQEFHNA